MTIRAMQAAERRRQQEELRRQRKLEREARENAKLSAIEQARFEVETYEKQLDALLSVHRPQGEAWDWVAVAASLPPPTPRRMGTNEQRAKQRAMVLPDHEKEAFQVFLDKAKMQDEEEFLNDSQEYAKEISERDKLKALALRVLAGEPKAFKDALVELNPFSEITDLGSQIHFTVHSSKLVECVLKVNGKQVIPMEIKTLTSSLSITHISCVLLPKIPEFLYVHCKQFVVQHWGCEPQTTTGIAMETPPWDGRTKVGSTKSWKVHTFKTCGWEDASGFCLG